MSKDINKNINKNLSVKHSQVLLDHAKQSAIDVLKIASKRAIQKPTEATGDFLVIKLLIKLRKSQTLLHRVIKKQLQMSIINKHLKKDRRKTENS